MISIVVAQAEDRVIGSNNDLPWYLPADLKHFRELTTGHPVLWGHNTFQSIIARRGSPLPNRLNIVVSKTQQPGEGYLVVRSIDEALTQTEKVELMVAGGASIYEQLLPRADRIYLTKIAAEVEGDTYFPELNMAEWNISEAQKHAADDKNPHNYEFITLNRNIRE